MSRARYTCQMKLELDSAPRHTGGLAFTGDFPSESDPSWLLRALNGLGWLLSWVMICESSRSCEEGDPPSA